MIDTSAMVLIADIPSDTSDENSLSNLAKVAERFLTAHHWCDHVIKGYLSYGWEGVLGVFLFEIEPTKQEIDRQLWLVVGDVPPAYLVCDDAPIPSLALRAYVEEMRLWVEAAKAGQSVDDLIPVYYRNSTRQVTPTLEFAEMLEDRLNSIEELLIPEAKSEGF